LDADDERLAASTFQCLETEGLIGNAAAPAVLAYLFHKIEQQLNSSPTLILIDEGWLVLDDVSFGRQLREWLKTLRKKNASVVFATQSLADIDASPIASSLIESCPTRILLPNARAFEPQIASLYRRFGLNTRQLEILATATPKRHYYVQQPHGHRLIDLGLGEVALAFAGASSKADHQLIDRLLAAHPPSDFARAWLVARGLDWAADLFDPNDGDTK
jgi:type IV secretion system protein VirB4